MTRVQLDNKMYAERTLYRYNKVHMVRSLARGIEKLVGRLDRWQQARAGSSFVYAVIRKYVDDEAGYRAALLAYYGFLAIFPLLLVLTTVFRIVLHNDPSLSNRIIRGAVSYFPAIGNDLTRNIHSLGQPGLALAIGILVTLFGARGVADVMRGSLDHIWQVSYARRRRFPDSLFRSLGIILVGGLALAIAPVVFGYALAFAPSRSVGVLSTLLTAIVLFWLLIWIIKVGTSTRQPLKRIWLGTILAVIILGLLQSAGGYIVARELQRLDTLYGTFALVLGLIFWLYLQTQVLLFALEIDSVRAFRLWPRSIQPPLTDADRTAYKLYHERGRFHDSFEV